MTTMPLPSGQIATFSSRPIDTVDLLELYGVPFAVFDRRGSAIKTSSAGGRLLTVQHPGILAQAARLVLDLFRGLEHDSQVRAIRPTADGRIQMRAHTLSDGRLMGFAVVLFLPPEREVPVPICEAWGLSARECDVARSLAAGRSAKEIAFELGISLHTARRHTEKVFSKLGVNSRAQVVLVLGAMRESDERPISACG